MSGLVKSEFKCSDEEIVLPRQDRLSWPEYFMSIAIVVSGRSPDPNRMVGCTLINTKNIIIGLGYNGTPRGFSSDLISWARDNNDELKNKYHFVIHAEANCLLNSNKETENSTLYTTMFPCSECAKLLIQSGVKKVIYLKDPYANTPSVIASKKMFSYADVITEQFIPTKDQLIISFK